MFCIDTNPRRPRLTKYNVSRWKHRWGFHDGGADGKTGGEKGGLDTGIGKEHTEKGYHCSLSEKDEPRQLDPMVLEDPGKGERIQVGIRDSKTVVDWINGKVGQRREMGDWTYSTSTSRMWGHKTSTSGKGKRVGGAYFLRSQ